MQLYAVALVLRHRSYLMAMKSGFHLARLTIFQRFALKRFQYH